MCGKFSGVPIPELKLKPRSRPQSAEMDHVIVTTGKTTSQWLILDVQQCHPFSLANNQCCGSGMEKIRIWDRLLGSYFRELRNNFLG
jgi:hypothetical protein